MSILGQKAKDKGLVFTSRYENIEETNEHGENNFMINCDEHRVMQVLLGL